MMKLFYSTRRSGSTLFSRSLAAHPEVITHANRVRFGLMKYRGGKPNYHYYAEQINNSTNKTIINKENFGELPLLLGGIKATNYSILPRSKELSAKIVEESQPILYLREPLKTANSLARAKMGGFEGFLKSYANALEEFEKIKNYDKEAKCLSHEHFITNTKQVINKLFSYWALNSSTTTTNESDLRNPTYKFNRLDERLLYTVHSSLNNKTLQRNKTIKNSDDLGELILKDWQINKIENEFGKAYAYINEQSNTFF